ncbi:MAG TPA: NUDIX domain-containing protein [Gemmatimonadales bacterium]|jgi:8-oxo-dGTP pyrophosphatase MutT (NUDIX family)
MLQHTQRLVEAFDPGPDARAAAAKWRILDLLRAGPSVFTRAHYDPGHITASAIVISERGDEVLLVFHKRLARWLQPGGHIDPGDHDTLAAARREVLEETGVLVGDDVALIGLDVHAIPAARGEPDHLHHDLVFRMRACTTALQVSEESTDVRWCAVTTLEDLKPDAALRSAVARATTE